MLIDKVNWKEKSSEEGIYFFQVTFIMIKANFVSVWPVQFHKPYS